MTPHEQDSRRRPSRANEDRARSAARRQAAAAHWALGVLAAHDVGPELSSTPVWRRLWIDVLRRRAADDVSPLSGLAATMSPPMTKDAFAGQLRRACRFAAAVDAGGSPAHRDPSSADFRGRRVENRSGAEEFTVNTGAPAPDEVW